MSFNFSCSFSRRLPAALLGAAIALVRPAVAVPQTSCEQAIAGIAKEVTAVVSGQNPGSGATAITDYFKNQLEFSGLKIWRATGSGEP